MPRIVRITLCAWGCVLSAAAAQAELSYNLGVVSLYKSNGLDQDSRTPKSMRPAVQGGVDKVFDNGFYLGNWNSSGRFGKANVEVDLYVGHRGQITDRLGYDVGVIRFLYPKSGDRNGNEAYVALTWGGLTAKYSHGVSGTIKDFGRLSLSYNLSLTDQWSAQATLGFRNRHAGKFDDYTFGLRRDMGDGLSVGIQWSGATHKAELGGLGDNRLILSLVQSF